MHLAPCIFKELSVQKFQVKVELDNPNAIMTMSGDLTHDCEKYMSDAYEKVASQKAKNILLDFTQVDYINSAGMSVIITLLTKAQNAEQSLIACGLSSHFLKIFDMIGLLKYIPHFDMRSEGLQNLGNA